MQFVRRIAQNRTLRHQPHDNLVIPIDRSRKIDGKGRHSLPPRPLVWLRPDTLDQTPLPPSGDFEPQIVGFKIPVTMIRYLDFDEIVPQARCVFRYRPPNGNAMRRLVRHPRRSSSWEGNQGGSRRRSRVQRRNYRRCRSRRWCRGRQDRSRTLYGPNCWRREDRWGVLFRRPGRHEHNDQNHHTDDNPQQDRRRPCGRLSPAAGRRNRGRTNFHATILRWDDRRLGGQNARKLEQQQV